MFLGFVSKKRLAEDIAYMYALEESDSRNGNKEERLRAWEAQSALNWLFSQYFTEKQRVAALKPYLDILEKEGKE